MGGMRGSGSFVSRSLRAYQIEPELGDKARAQVHIGMRFDALKRLSAAMASTTGNPCAVVHHLECVPQIPLHSPGRGRCNRRSGCRSTRSLPRTGDDATSRTHRGRARSRNRAQGCRSRTRNCQDGCRRNTALPAPGCAQPCATLNANVSLSFAAAGRNRMPTEPDPSVKSRSGRPPSGAEPRPVDPPAELHRHMRPGHLLI